MAPTPAVRPLAGLEPQDEEEEELLAALEESLEALGEESCCDGQGPVVAAAEVAGSSTGEPSSKALRSAEGAEAEAEAPAEGLHSKTLGYGLVFWPVEVRICVVSFLPWQELVRDSLLCRAWRALELEDVLWQVYFQTTWPRWTRRREANEDGGLPWRTLFRTRWSKCNHTEDALEEDWLDFSAAQDLHTGASPPSASHSSSAAATFAASEPSPAEIQRAVRRCRENLRQTAGVAVPAEAVRGHLCSRSCRFHRVSVEGDVFLCEGSGAVHRCRDGHPCDLCVDDDDSCYLVCPVSGRCFRYLRANSTEGEPQAGESAAAPTWDPELSMTEQYGRWFEQGYFMSEDQAKVLFELGDSRRPRRSACRA